MTAPTHGAWIRGALYLAQSDTGAASPLLEPVDFNYDVGLNNEERPYTNPASPVQPNISLLTSPSLAVNYNRRSDHAIVSAAARAWRSAGKGIRFYAYIDITEEPTAYMYGKAALEGVSLAGGAVAALSGSFTLKPGPEAEWTDTAFTY